MINKGNIKEKSEQLNIPFKNLLSAAVCEIVIELLANGKYCNELYLCNSAEFKTDVYKDLCISNIYYEYVRDLDDKMAILYMRDILKEIMAKGALEGMAVNGSVGETGISLKITVDDMYIPINLYFKKHGASHEPEKISLELIAYGNRKVDVLINPKEEELSKHLLEIIDKLELINNMDYYYDAYEILTSNPVNGRKVKDRLSELVKEKGIVIDDSRLNMLKSYGDYTYMKRKWKVELRQKKKSEPQWSDVNNCLMNFLSPIWDAMEKNMVFLGDWMPQLKRFLD
ncbi:hypothetical protein [Pseudobutyrivibrio ruminis]|uniref:Nucleotidyl transferase AbiEii toxin, Type IV TA system n=1 Tax=Pseudobutyrivibrio ruminis DSM 9787 TaxID=1123011 RepID=A0A285SQB5_9FIRM|nr:hypothetical protein [Pseudobutyrivibrio ruminis]SOC10412.1 hypothetical protein SAMN02910411_2654 [Pseudobutyrivibrio ruminis DSM 9787]